MLRVIGYLFILVCIQSSICYAQEPKVKVSAYDGIVIVGYVDNGGFSNFTGPNVNLVYKHSKFILGALPSLRYKQDNSTPKNSFVTPNLGIGFTYSYKMFAVQLPLYYNAKTATQNGNWQIGFGLGLRLNELNTKNKKI
jgi:hypothetical protein